MRTKIKAFFVLAATLLAAACSRFNDPEYVTIYELVPASHEIVVDMEGGEATVSVYSNGTFHSEVISSIPGVVLLSPATQSGDADVVLNIPANTSRQRDILVRISLEGTDIEDTICFKQKGSIL